MNKSAARRTLLLVACLVLATSLLSRVLAQTSGVQIALSPTPKTATVGDVFDMDVIIHAGAQPLDGVQVYMDFEPASLQMVEIMPDLNAMNTVLGGPTWDNTTGKLSYASGILVGSAITGTFRIATLRFHAIAPTNRVTISFDITAPPLPVTKVSYLGEVIIPTPIHGVVQVLPSLSTATITPTSEPTITPTATPTAAPFSGYVRQGDRRCSDALSLPYYFLEACQGQQSVVFNVGLSRYLGQYVTIWGTLGAASICPGVPESGIIGYQIELSADPCVTPTPSVTSTGTATLMPSATETPTATATHTVSSTETPTHVPTTAPSATSTPTVPAGYGILQGRVILPGRANNLGAAISAGAHSTASNTGGYFNLALPPGSHAVTIAMNGYLQAYCPAVGISAGVTTVAAEATLLSGDVNGDCDVDLFDLVAVAANFNQTPPVAPPQVDLNSDGQVNILDVVMVASNYGRLCPSPWTCP